MLIEVFVGIKESVSGWENKMKVRDLEKKTLNDWIAINSRGSVDIKDRKGKYNTMKKWTANRHRNARYRNRQFVYAIFRRKNKQS